MKVSVICLTYNHEAYIAEALESILMQRTDFDFEIIVSDDCSTDNTQAVIREYQKKFREKFFCIYNEVNIGVIPNLVQALQHCKGEYIGCCDGDDYWTDPLKLQIQVDILEQDPQFVVCAHSVAIKMPDQLLHQEIDESLKITDGRALALGNYVPGASVLYKNFSSVMPFPHWISECRINDWAMFVYLGQFGKIKLLGREMSVYRFTKSGIFSKLSSVDSTRNYIQTAYLMLSKIEDSQTLKNLRLFLAGQYIKLLSLHHRPEIEKKIRWNVFREIRLTGVKYNLQQYRYILVYLFDIFFQRKKFSVT